MAEYKFSSLHCPKHDPLYYVGWTLATRVATKPAGTFWLGHGERVVVVVVWDGYPKETLPSILGSAAEWMRHGTVMNN